MNRLTPDQCPANQKARQHTLDDLRIAANARITVISLHEYTTLQSIAAKGLDSGEGHRINRETIDSVYIRITGRNPLGFASAHGDEAKELVTKLLEATQAQPPFCGVVPQTEPLRV